MTADLSSVAREAAERSGHYPETMLGHRQLQRAYALGFTECASRLPSETEIAETIAAGYDSVYTSRLPVNEHDHRAARAVLALIGEKISGKYWAKEEQCGTKKFERSQRQRA